MLTSKSDKAICARYSKPVDGKVGCSVCPLLKGDPSKYDFRCKANSHYDKKKKEWVSDLIDLNLEMYLRR